MTAALRYEDESAAEDIRNALAVLVAAAASAGVEPDGVLLEREDLVAIRARLEAAAVKLERRVKA